MICSEKYPIFVGIPTQSCTSYRHIDLGYGRCRLSASCMSLLGLTTSNLIYIRVYPDKIISDTSNRNYQEYLVTSWPDYAGELVEDPPASLSGSQTLSSDEIITSHQASAERELIVERLDSSEINDDIHPLKRFRMVYDTAVSLTNRPNAVAAQPGYTTVLVRNIHQMISRMYGINQ